MTVKTEPLKKLRGLKADDTLILGMGNRLKGDDAAGSIICDMLLEKVACEVIDCETTPENYIGTISKAAPKNLIIIDAVNFSKDPGEFRIFDPSQIDAFSVSTHCPSPKLFLTIIYSVISLKVYIIGIQPKNLDFNTSLSEEVAQSIKGISDYLISIMGENNN